MKSCQDYLSELRQKLSTAEDQLRIQKKNLYKSQEFCTEEKERCKAEIRELETKIHGNKIQISEKEAVLENLKTSYDVAGKKLTELLAENEKLKEDLQKTKKQKEDKVNWFHMEQGYLEKELSKVQDQIIELKASNKLSKIFHNKELRAHEADEEDHLKDEMKQMSDDFAKKIEMLHENFQEIDKVSFEPKKKRLVALRETLENINKECQELEEKNRALEKQIQLMEKK